jgi:hypothetical protein
MACNCSAGGTCGDAVCRVAGLDTAFLLFIGLLTGDDLEAALVFRGMIQIDILMVSIFRTDRTNLNPNGRSGYRPMVLIFAGNAVFVCLVLSQD